MNTIENPVMSLPVYAGIGAGIGAVCGGAVGYYIKNKTKLVPKPSSDSTLKPSTTATTSKTEELFGVKVTYLLSSSEFYNMLVRFENYLQFATERDSLKSAVQDLDNFLGMEALLHGRDPISKAALPTLAEVARRKVIDVLNNIIVFSNEQRPSKTKQDAMLSIKDEINQIMIAIVKDMNRALAALPAVITKTK